MCSGEDIILCPALNIEAKSAEWSELLILADTWQPLNMCVLIHVNLDLTVGHLLFSLAFCPVLCLDTHPAHATYFIVNHEALNVWDI